MLNLDISGSSKTDINGNIVKTDTRESADYLQGTELTINALAEAVTYIGKEYIVEKGSYDVVVGNSDQTITFKYNYSLKRVEAAEVSYDVEDAAVTYVDAIKSKSTKKGYTVQKPVPSKVVLNGKTLRNKTDYTVTYQNASGEEVQGVTEPGDYKIILTGTENTGKGKTTYTGVKVLDITVMENNEVSMNTVKVAVNAVNYTGSEITEGIIKSVKNGKNELKEGIDFTVDYSNTANSGTQTITLTAIEGSGYVGTKTVNVNVKGYAISKVKVTGITAVDYNGTGDLQQDLADVKLTYTYKVSGTTVTDELILDEDYTVSYENNDKAGTAKITFTGIGQYNGTLKKTFKINKAKIATTVNKVNVINSEYCEVESSFTATADKKKGAQLTDMVVSYNGVELVLGTDYTLSYSNNKADAKTVASWATLKKPKYPQVTITGKGNYQGKITLNFEITD